MPLAPPLARLIEGKLAHTTAQQWEMPIAAVRDGFAYVGCGYHAERA